MQNTQALMQDLNSKTIQMVGNKLIHGVTSVTTAGTEVRLLTEGQKTLCVIIKANTTNTGVIYVGNSAVASSNGYALAAGETVQLWLDNAQDAIYIDASVGGEGVTYIGWLAE